MGEENNDKVKDRLLMDAFEGMERLEALTDEEFQQLLADDELRHDMSLLEAVNQTLLRRRFPSPDAEQMWQQFRQQHILPVKERRKSKVRVIAASLLSAAAVLALVFMLQPNAREGSDSAVTDEPLMAFTRDTTPQVVRLSDDQGHEQVAGQAAEKQNVRMGEMVADFSVLDDMASPNETARWKTISTPRGKVYKVILPDKTQVLMNADSKLTFPEHFDAKERVVKLEGEAFFTVTKNAHQPFIVESEKVRTHVLGTEFNLRAYPSSRPHVTLVSGQVVVDNLMNHERVTMKPGQDVTLNKQQRFDVSAVDTEYYIQWKEGYFYFDNLPLVEVLKELGRWYNVDIRITDNSLMSYRLHFIADRSASIDQVVENLNGFSYLQVYKNGDGIVVSPKSVQRK